MRSADPWCQHRARQYGALRRCSCSAPFARPRVGAEAKLELAVTLTAAADRGAVPATRQQVRDQIVGLLTVKIRKLGDAQNPIRILAVPSADGSDDRKLRPGIIERWLHVDGFDAGTLPRLVVDDAVVVEQSHLRKREMPVAEALFVLEQQARAPALASRRCVFVQLLHARIVVGAEL